MSSSENKIADHRERLRALEPTQSFIVQAPAGSGKTELLVRRFLGLLAVVERPERVLAITFTRKAAGEMRERITSALRAAASGVPAESDYEAERISLAEKVLQRSRDNDWDLLRNPRRLQVYTIDSLCSRLSFLTPLLSRFGATPQTTEDPASLYREAARRVLSKVNDGSEVGDAVGVLLSRQELRLEELSSQIVFVLERRDQWWRSVLDSSGDPVEVLDDLECAFEAMMKEHIERLAGLVGDRLIGHIEKLAVMTHINLVDKNKDCEWPTLGRGAKLRQASDGQVCWAEAGRMLMPKTAKAFRKRGGITASVGAAKDTEARDLYLSVLDEVDALPTWRRRAILELFRITAELPASSHFGPAAREGLTALFCVLRASVETLWFVFAELEQVDFVDVGMKAVMALGKDEAPSDLLLGLDNVIDHVLVDEFQDTNLMQCSLVSALTSGFSEGDGRSLFLVGDPMQSIYRFRKAEVGLFLQAADRDRRLFRSVNLEPLTLTVNFRSAHSIVDWVNSTFATLMAEDDDAEMGLVKYHPSVARPQAPDGSAVEVVCWHGDEGAGTAALIAEVLLPATRQRNGTVAVLVRRKKDAVPIMEALDTLGIRYHAEEMGVLSGRPVVQDLQSLTRFLVHRGDRLSGLALLHSPFVGLGSDDLCVLVEPGVAEAKKTSDVGRPGKVFPPSITEMFSEPEALARLSEDARGRVEYCAKVVSEARAQLGRTPLHLVVRGAWLRLGGAVLLDDAAAIDAERYFKLLEATDHASGLDIDELERRLFDLKASGDPSAGIDVELMTIHKAKGLEFDTVVIPSLGMPGTRGARPPMIMETDGASGLMTICAPRHERGRASDDDAKFTFLDSREKVRDESESLRLIYVAATRARQRLVLSTADVFNRDGTPRAGSLLGMLWPAIADQVHTVEPSVDSLVEPDAHAPLVRIRGDWGSRVDTCTPADLEVRTLTAVRPSAEATKPDSGDLSPSPRFLAVGHVVHGFLERIARDGLEKWPQSRVSDPRAQARIRRDLMSEGVTTTEIVEALSEVTEALDNTLSDDQGRWLLQASHDAARTEWRLTRYKEVAAGAVEFSNASIDRSFRDETGCRWIVDYKTDRLIQPMEPAEFLEHRFEHHRAQLEEYASMVAESGVDPQGTEIRIAAYFPMLPVPPGLGRLKYETYDPQAP